MGQSQDCPTFLLGPLYLSSNRMTFRRVRAASTLVLGAPARRHRHSRGVRQRAAIDIRVGCASALTSTLVSGRIDRYENVCAFVGRRIFAAAALLGRLCPWLSS